jgi:molybdate transport system ATP-binding protein
VIDIALQLSVADGRRRFALDLSFATEAPVVALYGPSGAGKSLALQAVAGLLRPQAGHVRVAGRTLFDAARGVDLSPPERRVGLLFQQYALFPHLSVRQNIAFGLTSWRRRLSPGDAARVDALIDGFGLAGLAHSRPATLSGGQQQRVALARALACEPQLLLLDEPFAALHPGLRQQLRDELRDTRQRHGLPMLLITHDIEDVLALADLALRIEDGRVVREVDLRTAQSRERTRQALEPAPARAPHPHEAALRHLLDAPPHA